MAFFFLIIVLAGFLDPGNWLLMMTWRNLIMHALSSIESCVLVFITIWGLLFICTN